MRVHGTNWFEYRTNVRENPGTLGGGPEFEINVCENPSTLGG